MSLDSLIIDTRKAITGDAAAAQAAFTAQATLVGVTEVDIKSGAHTFKVDEPPALGGADIAANPVQYALASLGSCQAITYRIWATHLGIKLDALTVRVAGDLDLRGFFSADNSMHGFTAVQVEVTVTGPETEERYAELAAAVDGTAGPRPVQEPRASDPRPRRLEVGPSAFRPVITEILDGGTWVIR